MSFRYSDTGQTVPVSDAHYSLYICDLDAWWEGAYLEGVWLNEGARDTVYLKRGGVIDGDRVVFTGFVSGADIGLDASTFNGGFVTQNTASEMNFTWQGGNGCGTDFKFTAMSWPGHKVSVGKSVPDDVLFEGDDAVFTVSSFWPYHDPAVRPYATEVTDVLDAAFDASRARVSVTCNGRDVTAGAKTSTSGQTLTVRAEGVNVWRGDVAVTIRVPVRAGFGYDGYRTCGIDGGEAYLVPNKAQASAAVHTPSSKDFACTSGEASARQL